MSKTTIPAGGLSSDSVTTAKIADDAVTAAKATGFGKVGQVVQASTSTAVNVASTSVADTGLTVNITPTATTSKVLVQVNQNILTDIDTELGNSKIKLLRDSTTAIDFTTNIARVEANGSSAVKFGNLTTFSYLDSPSTTSQITYKTQGAISSTSNNGTARFQNSSVPSVITVMEILA
tara:strand:- start:160 stop:693 length:534 start_codon:yes stop_codon:yes gene_type:complete